MRTNNIIQDKTYSFALKVVKLTRQIAAEKKEFILTNQLLRCGTSIGANVEEAIGGQSRKDFSSKMNIAYKEARESHYWIRLMSDSEILSKEKGEELLDDLDEILRISGSILRKVKSSENTSNFNSNK
jgi:four helix bundle protein